MSAATTQFAEAILALQRFSVLEPSTCRTEASEPLFADVANIAPAAIAFGQHVAMEGMPTLNGIGAAPADRCI